MAIRGVLTRKSLAQTTANYSSATAVAWNQDVYDTNNFHDADSSATAIVIPSSVNGQYGIFTFVVSLSNVTATSEVTLEIQKGASAAYIGYAAFDRNTGAQGTGLVTTDAWVQITSSPILLTTGDSYTAVLTCSDTSITVNVESSFGLYVCDQANLTQRCQAQLNADQTTQNYSTPAVVAWDGTDIYDTDNIHDPSSNNSKMIIPASLNGKAGVIQASIITTLQVANQSTSMAIQKNGSLLYNGFGGNSGLNQNGVAQALFQVQTQVISFTTGDTFEALFYSQDTSITIAKNTATRFSLWVYGDSPC